MFSVIVPIHNKLPHLDRSILSILNQSCADFELILIDDASTDGSSEKFLDYNDSRIKRFTRKTPGPGGYAARNLGIENSTQEWIVFLDADDEWSLNALENLKNSIERHPDSELVAFNWEMVMGRDKMALNNYPENNFNFTWIDYLRNSNLIVTGNFAIKKQLIERAGGFLDNEICTRGGDVETYVRWLKQSQRNFFVNEVCFYYYRDTVNRVTDNKKNYNNHFCAYNTLMKYYSKETDKKNRKIIRRFVNKFLYNMVGRQVKAGLPLDYGECRKMFIDSYAIARILKLHLMRVRIVLGFTQ